MSIPYFPLYPTDFEADTSHLSLAEDGAYNRLLRLSWMTPGCSLPDDDAWIKRRMRVSKSEFDDVVKVVIDEFFTRSRGRIYNKKLREIHCSIAASRQARSEAGRKGGIAKAVKYINKKNGNDKDLPKQNRSNQNQNQNHKEERDTNVSQRKPTKAEIDAEATSILSTVCSFDVAADFIEHRKELKARVTVLAAKRIANSLSGHHDPDAAVNLSIERGWRGVFPEKVKDVKNGGSYSSRGQADLDAWERAAIRVADSRASEDASQPLLAVGRPGNAGRGDSN